MKRLLIQAAAFLALGAISNVTAAIYCCLCIQGSALTSWKRVDAWPHPVDSSWESWADEVQYRCATGLRESSAIGEKSGEWRLEQGKQFYFECGAPWLSLRRTMWREESRLEKTPLDAREPEHLGEGVMIPSLAHVVGSRRTIIPVVPVWPGFALGTLFYAAIAALIIRTGINLTTALRSPAIVAGSPRGFYPAVIAGCFGLGMMVGTSWFCINQKPESSDWWEAPESSTWPCPVPRSWPSPELRSMHSFGGGQRFVWADCWRPPVVPADGSAQTAETFEVKYAEGGWPLPALSYAQGAAWVVNQQTGRRGGATQLELSLFRSGIHMPANAPDGLSFPLWPVFPGFVLNCLFFTAVISGARSLATAMRSTFRHRRNLCPRCSYSRDGLATDSPCPECGATTTPPAIA